MGIVKGVEWSAFTITTILFPYLMEWMHFYGLNYYYAFISLALIFWSLTIKDTDGLSLVEIEQIYCHRTGLSSVEIIAKKICRFDLDLDLNLLTYLLFVICELNQLKTFLTTGRSRDLMSHLDFLAQVQPYLTNDFHAS